MNQRIPATVVTGFLGAGKTTLIRNLIRNARGRRIAVIVNEFGDMGFDGGLLADCGDDECRPDQIVELTNGCICCTVADEFLPTMEALLKRDPAPDHIVIETSGLALPQPLVQAFNWPSVRHRVTVDGVVTVVDAVAVSEGRFAPDAEPAPDPARMHDDPVEELFEDQLLLLRQFLRHGGSRDDMEVTVTASAHVRHALAPYPEARPRLSACGDGQVFAAVERRHFDAAAKGECWELNRQLAVEVIPLAVKEIVILDVDDDVEIAGGAAGAAMLPFAGEAHLLACGNTRRNLHAQPALVLNAPRAAA